MGLRIRKSVKIAPGIRVNLGKKGASLSIGGKGATTNIGKKGVKTTLGIPGTGVSHSTKPKGCLIYMIAGVAAIVSLISIGLKVIL